MENIREMRFKISSDVVAHDLGDGVFIYNNKLGTCFGLEGMGLEIWRMVCDGKTVEDIIRTIRKDYEIDEVKVSEDVESFINKLLQHELLEIN